MTDDYTDENLLKLSIEKQKRHNKIGDKEEIIESLTRLIEHLRDPDLILGDFCYNLTTEKDGKLVYQAGKVCTPEALFAFSKGNFIYLHNQGVNIHELEEVSDTLQKLTSDKD